MTLPQLAGQDGGELVRAATRCARTRTRTRGDVDVDVALGAKGAPVAG